MLMKCRLGADNLGSKKANESPCLELAGVGKAVMQRAEPIVFAGQGVSHWNAATDC